MKTSNNAVRSNCPHCNPPFDPWIESQCILNKPLMIVIPPEGMHLSCPAHPEGHYVFGTGVVWCDSGRAGVTPDYDSTQKFIDYDSTRSPGSTCTGDTVHDTFKVIS